MTPWQQIQAVLAEMKQLIENSPEGEGERLL